MAIDQAALETTLSKMPKADLEAFFRVVKAVLEEMSPTITSTPQGPFVPQDYAKKVEIPQTGWISDSDIKAVNQKVTESIVAGKFAEGFLACLKLLAALSTAGA